MENSIALINRSTACAHITCKRQDEPKLCSKPKLEKLPKVFVWFSGTTGMIKSNGGTHKLPIYGMA